MKTQERRAAELQLRIFRDNYAQTHDPFLPWLAYRLTRRHGLRLPPWARAYLDGVAAQLEALYDRRPEPKGKLLNAAIARALEMKRPGRGTVFDLHRRHAAAQGLAYAVSRFKAERGATHNLKDLAAERRVDVPMIVRVYRQVTGKNIRKRPPK